MPYTTDPKYEHKLLIYTIKRINEIDFEDNVNTIIRKFTDLNKEDLPKNLPIEEKKSYYFCLVCYRIIKSSLLFNWMSHNYDQCKILFESKKFKRVTINKIKEFQQHPGIQMCKFWKGEEYYLEKLKII